MARSRLLSHTLTGLSVGLLLACSSCTEHKKLEAQTKEIREKIEELQALKEAKGGTGPVKRHPLARKGAKFLQASVSVMEEDIAMLEARRVALEAEMAELEKDMAEYRAKNL